MKFRIPFTRRPVENSQKRKFFESLVSHKKFSKFQDRLESIDVNITREKYLGIVLGTFITFTIITFILSSTVFIIFNIPKWFIISPLLSLLVGGFVVMRQLLYPKVYASRKQKDIEKNLIPALDDMLVQLNAGVPLFNIIVNLSNANYSELSNEFKKAARKINAGQPQVEVLEEIGRKNPSIFFRRTLWQISNGMRAGSDISVIIRESIRSLNEEQLLQIQNYGNKLNPLIMFYMLISVILPALAITFMTIIASMVNMEARTTMLIFISMFVMVTIIQFMFIGIIKSVRPSLL